MSSDVAVLPFLFWHILMLPCHFAQHHFVWISLIILQVASALRTCVESCVVSRIPALSCTKGSSSQCHIRLGEHTAPLPDTAPKHTYVCISMRANRAGGKLYRLAFNVLRTEGCIPMVNHIRGMGPQCLHAYMYHAERHRLLLKNF